MDQYDYIGTELSLFAQARNWKKYYGSKIRPYIGKRVVEVGAGLGSTTQVLCTGESSEWVCLEPDQKLLKNIDVKIKSGALPQCCVARKGVIQDIGVGNLYDTIVYIDVLEHIEFDAKELSDASLRLVTGGYVIALSPAYDFLYSPFDRSVGHYRRYTKKKLQDITPPMLSLKKVIYLDSVGVCASLANRLFLKQGVPTERQILFWDTILLPIARIIDPLVGYMFGRSIVGVWQKKG